MEQPDAAECHCDAVLVAGVDDLLVADGATGLDDGRMVGLGRHAELLESCPVYKEIYESQFKKGDAQK